MTRREPVSTAEELDIPVVLQVAKSLPRVTQAQSSRSSEGAIWHRALGLLETGTDET